MKRVTGIGGIFFKAKDPVALRAWYQKHLGIDVQPWGGTAFFWADDAGNPMKGTTIWNIGEADPALLAALRAEGCQVLDKTDDSEYGKFGWVIDPEGNKVELWQPPPGS
jgi:hypothetical protein